MLFLTLVLVVPTVLAIVVAMLFQAVRAALRRAWLRALGMVSCGATAVVLGLAALTLMGAVSAAEQGGSGSSPLIPCRIPGQPVERVVDYRIDLLPLGFSCVLADGSSYGTDEVPWYLTPLAGGLALLAAGALYAGRNSPRTAEG